MAFKAPCDCNAVAGLKVYFPNDKGVATSQVFLFADAHGNNLTGIGHLFTAGAIVKVILHVDEGKAYIQNADTNAYLENRFATIDVSGPISDHNASSTAHSDIRAAVSDAASAASAAQNAANSAVSELARFQNNLGNECVWEKKSQVLTDVIVFGTTTSISKFYSGSSSTWTVYTKAEIVDGKIVLSGPVSVSYSNGAGYYAYKSNVPYYIASDSGATSASGTYSNDKKAQKLTLGQESVLTPVGYVNSDSPDTYPQEDGAGNAYALLGRLGNKIECVVGSYTGTGKNGPTNKNTLSFDGKPALVIVSALDGIQKIFLMRDINASIAVSGSSIVKNTVFWEGNSVSWCSTNSASSQLNESGEEYSYFALVER